MKDRKRGGGGGESKSPVEKSRSVELETNFLNRTKESFSGQFRFSPFFFSFFFFQISLLTREKRFPSRADRSNRKRRGAER